MFSISRFGSSLKYARVEKSGEYEYVPQPRQRQEDPLPVIGRRAVHPGNELHEFPFFHLTPAFHLQCVKPQLLLPRPFYLHVELQGSVRHGGAGGRRVEELGVGEIRVLVKAAVMEEGRLVEGAALETRGSLKYPVLEVRLIEKCRVFKIDLAPRMPPPRRRSPGP